MCSYDICGPVRGLSLLGHESIFVKLAGFCGLLGSGLISCYPVVKNFDQISVYPVFVVTRVDLILNVTSLQEIRNS